MTKFTLALCAGLALSMTACTNTLYNHRKDFSPKQAGGPWQTEYENLYRGEKRVRAEAEKGENSRRPLWRPGKWHDYHWTR